MLSRINIVATKLVFALSFSFFSIQAMAAGALAIDNNQGNQYGWAASYSNTGQAEQHALSECGGGCQIVLRYSSGCGAYAADQAGGSSASEWKCATTLSTTS